MAIATQTIQTQYGAASVRPSSSGQTIIHTITNWMWLPALVMGGMAIVGAIGLGIAQADAAHALRAGFSAGSQTDFETLKPLTAGTLFLGEALVLAGISFLLATILGALRRGGGEVQESAGALVKTLKMPWSAWVFLGLMMAGVAAQAVAFGSLVYVATQAHDAWSGATAAGIPADLGAFNTAATWSTWANPLREVSLGLLLGGIAFALYTISNVLGFQFSRIRELISGREEGAN